MAGFTLIIHYKMGVLKTQVIEHFTRVFRKELGHQWWCWWVPVGRLRRAPKELRTVSDGCVLAPARSGGIPPGVAGLRGMSCCLGTATFPFYCLTLLFAVVVSRVVVAIVPARWLPASLQLRGQLQWWPVVLVVTGVCCLQLCLHAAACRCWWLSPAAAVAAPSRGLVCSPGAVVAAGLL